MAEVFPPAWLCPEALEWVIAFIEWLPIPPPFKKRALMEWGEYAGVRITAEMVQRVTGLAIGEI